MSSTMTTSIITSRSTWMTSLDDHHYVHYTTTQPPPCPTCLIGLRGDSLPSELVIRVERTIAKRLFIASLCKLILNLANSFWINPLNEKGTELDLSLNSFLSFSLGLVAL